MSRIPKRFWLILVGVLICVMLMINANVQLEGADLTVFSVQRARVLTVDNSRLTNDPVVEAIQIGRQTVEMELLSGPHRGQVIRIDSTINRFFNIVAQENMTILASVVTDEQGNIQHVDVFGYAREGFMYGFIALFFLVLILVGRKKGVYSVLSLVFTLCVVVFFMIPAILSGKSPILFAVITAIVTAAFSILIISDFTRKSVAAIGGTIIGVFIAGLVSFIASNIAHISGLQVEHAEEVLFQAQGTVQVTQLLVAGIIIASLGAVMDVGMSIASVIYEMKEVNPKMGFKELYKSGMNVGRDVMGTMSNTLILAFAGSSITVLIIIVSYQLPYIRLINLDLLALEVIQGLSASIGLILAVPATALLGGWLASRSK